MTDATPTQDRHFADLGAPALAALVPAGTLIWHMGWPLAWPGLLLPLSLAFFSFVWTLGLRRIAGRRAALISGLVLGVGLAHLMLWLPFLLVSYAGGQGAARLDYALLSALVTSAAVAWYILGEFLWQSLVLAGLIGAALLGLRMGRGRGAG